MIELENESDETFFFISKTLEADDTILKWSWLNLFVECFLLLSILLKSKQRSFGNF